MKAAQISEYGATTNIKVANVDIPKPNPNQVQVKVAAASLNPFDSAVLAGYAQSMAPLNFPATLGLDFAGTITKVGEGVTEFQEGDRVYGTANAMFGGSGAFAEYVSANTGSIALSPSNISDAEAAALPTAGISAWQAITKELDLKKGQKIFINGGTGGVGSFAIQIAKHIGAHVAVTASSDNTEFAKSLGADEVIDYKTTAFNDVLRNYDAVLNNVRSENTNDILGVLKKGGVASSLAGGLDSDDAQAQGSTAINQMTNVSTSSLDALRELVEQNAVKPAIDTTFKLDDIQQAYGTLADKSVKGKIVISVQ